MLFKERFHEGIRSGSVTVTFRAWASARVKVGGRYRFGRSDIVEVESIERVKLASIGERQARAAGFTTAVELRRELGRTGRRELGPADRVFAVSFRYLGERQDPRVALRADVSPEALSELRRELERMDRRSRRGPWTESTLRAIASRPRTAASQLAAELGLETRVFKASVRRLKALSLTVSYPIGYELSPRGRAVLAWETAE